MSEPTLISLLDWMAAGSCENSVELPPVVGVAEPELLFELLPQALAASASTARNTGVHFEEFRISAPDVWGRDVSRGGPVDILLHAAVRSDQWTLTVWVTRT